MTVRAALDPEVKVFRELLIAIARDQTGELEELVEKYGLETVENAVKKAIDCQGLCKLKVADEEEFVKILSGPTRSAEKATFQALVVFWPHEELMAALSSGLQAQENDEPEAS